MQIADGGGGVPAIGQSIFDSINTFANTAAQGGFEVSEQGGDALIAVIERFQHWANETGHLLDQLAQERKLGGSNGAKVMTPFLTQVVVDDQGFATQLKALGKSLEKAKEGIQKAMENYRATEEANKGKARTIEV
jgi:carbamate kinase